MSGQKFTLLKFPHSTDEIIYERIQGLERLLCEANDERHINALIHTLITHISVNYEGVYIDHMISKLIESHHWWLECCNPDATLAVDDNADFEE